MEILLFFLWLAVMAIAGARIYLAHKSLKRFRKTLQA